MKDEKYWILTAYYLQRLLKSGKDLQPIVSYLQKKKQFSDKPDFVSQTIDANPSVKVADDVSFMRQVRVELYTKNFRLLIGAKKIQKAEVEIAKTTGRNLLISWHL